jgi:hypothetical protein
MGMKQRRFTCTCTEEEAEKLYALLSLQGTREIKRGTMTKVFHIFLETLMKHPDFLKVCQAFNRKKDTLRFRQLLDIMEEGQDV